ncbi:MAG: hypothetical protein AAF357_13345 [Verrucomicrobiota bacterium]
MSRNLAIILLSAALLSCLYFCVYHWITADTKIAMKAERPELEWLRYEYDLSDQQFSTIRAKHETHDVVCRELCKEMVAAQKQLDAAIAEHPGLTPEVKDALAAWTAKRERSREAAIAHMYDVSSAMDRENAARYRERIFRHLIVPGRMPHVGKNGEFNEDLIEHAAPGSVDSAPSGNDGPE